MNAEAELLRTAFHESGHVVASLILGRAPGLVSIVPSEHFSGIAFGRGPSVSQRDRAKLGRPLPLLPASLRRFVEIEGTILLAGPLAERLVWPPQEGYLPPAADEQEAERLVSLLRLSPRERDQLAEAASSDPSDEDEQKAFRLAFVLGDGLAGAYMGLLWAMAREIVGSPEFQRDLERLVPPLLEHRTLPARAIRALLNGEGVKTNGEDAHGRAVHPPAQAARALGAGG